MGTASGLPPAALKNKKMIMFMEATTSANRCGCFLCAHFPPCIRLPLRQHDAGFFSERKPL